MDKVITDEFRRKLKKIYNDEKQMKRKVIFIDKKDINDIHFPWKKLTKEYKLKLIEEYIKRNKIDFDIKKISDYKLINIEYEKRIETIHHIEFQLK